jgi:hypothetical protein
MVHEWEFKDWWLGIEESSLNYAGGTQVYMVMDAVA